MCINPRSGIGSWSLLQCDPSRAKDAGDQRQLRGGLWSLEPGVSHTARGKLPTRPREGTLAGPWKLPEPKITLHFHLPLHLCPLH